MTDSPINYLDLGFKKKNHNRFSSFGNKRAIKVSGRSEDGGRREIGEYLKNRSICFHFGSKRKCLANFLLPKAKASNNLLRLKRMGGAFTSKIIFSTSVAGIAKCFGFL